MPGVKKRKLAMERNCQYRFSNAPSFATQTEKIKMISTGTQTDIITETIRDQIGNRQQAVKSQSNSKSQVLDSHSTYKSVIDNFSFDQVGILVDLLIDSLEEWHAIPCRILSVMIYTIIRLCKLQYEEARKVLDKLNLLS